MEVAFHGRKSHPTKIVMADADFDLQVTFVLVGLEGTTHDALILWDALERENGLHVPQANIKCINLPLWLISDRKLITPCGKTIRIVMPIIYDSYICYGPLYLSFVWIYVPLLLCDDLWQHLHTIVLLQGSLQRAQMNL
jgi:hypothetical protein